MCEHVLISYRASETTLAVAEPKADAPPHAKSAPSDAAPPANVRDGFAHLDVFGRLAPVQPIKAADETTETLLLDHASGEAALYIDLSEPVDAISLLFVVEAGPDGWSTGESLVSWQKQVGGTWLPVKVMQDGTAGLRNSGIVALQIGTTSNDHPETASRLRAVLARHSHNSSYVTMILPNALALEWVPPAGADTLAVPLPAGTISNSQLPIAGIASIRQPVAGFGGVPPATGTEFHLWMAERLRHKGRAIASDDYARMILAALPSLWQLAVVPACRGPDGRRAPGHVWLVAVAGPTTPNISDPTAPEVDPVTLGQIQAQAAAAMSPFVELTVTNPPWNRICVHATVQFSPLDTAQAWMARLNDELRRWLSPWPDPLLPPRPAVYWTRQAIAEFVHNRPYVVEVKHLTLRHAQPCHDDSGWHYFTSAASHALTVYDQAPMAAGTASAGAA
jgi:hypothetical protein